MDGVASWRAPPATNQSTAFQQSRQTGGRSLAPPFAADHAVFDTRTIWGSIHQHGRDLATYAHRLLTEIPGVRLLGPSPDKKSAIVSFVVDRLHPHDVAHLLNTQGVAIRAGQHCAMPLHQRLGLTATTRASFYLYNTAAEVAALAAALIQVAETISRGRLRPVAAVSASV